MSFLLPYAQTAADSETKQQSIWRELPDVPYYCSSACVVDGVLLSIGGKEGIGGEEGSKKKTSAIYAFHPTDKKWQHIGDMPFECSSVDTLLLSDGILLVVDGCSRKVMRVTVKGKYMQVLNSLYNISSIFRSGYVFHQIKVCVRVCMCACICSPHVCACMCCMCVYACCVCVVCVHVHIYMLVCVYATVSSKITLLG